MKITKIAHKILYEYGADDISRIEITAKTNLGEFTMAEEVSAIRSEEGLEKEITLNDESIGEEVDWMLPDFGFTPFDRGSAAAKNFKDGFKKNAKKILEKWFKSIKIEGN